MKIIIGLLIVLVLIGAGTAGYFIFQNQKLMDNISSTSPQPISTPIVSASASPILTSPSPLLNSLEEVTAAIETSLNSTDASGLTDFTKDTVFVTLMSTECCGEVSQSEALDQLTYVSTGEPFNFDQTTNLIQNLKAKNIQLADTHIGISIAGEQLVAFTLDSNNVISKIQLSVSHQLYEN